MRAARVSIVIAVVFAGCGSSGTGSGGSGGGTGGTTSASGGLSGQAGHPGAGGSGGASATGGSGTGGVIAGTGGAGTGGHGGNGGARQASGGSAAGGSGTGGGGTGGGGTGGSAGAAGHAGSGGVGGTTGMSCGGLLGRSCDADQWCDFSPDTCGAGDQGGVCQSRQINGALCAPSPICGCDGKTYPSACNAHAAGTDTMATNACISGNGGAGAPCVADTDCTTGFKCCPTGGSIASPIACRQVAAGSQCPALP